MRSFLFFALIVLVSCTPQDKPASAIPGAPTGLVVPAVQRDNKTLKSWWVFFEDPVLERFITSALALNPPKGEDVTDAGVVTNDYEAYRLQYHDDRIDLIKKVSALYLEYRYLQNQNTLIEGYIEDHETIEQAANSKNFLKDPRAVPYQKAYVASAEMSNKLSVQLEKNARALALSTKLLPEYIAQVLKENSVLPPSDLTPILASPISVFANAPDISAARALFSDRVRDRAFFKQSLDIFPVGTLNAFLGVSDNVFIDPKTGWSVTPGSAVENLQLESYQKKYRQSPAYVDFEATLFDRVKTFERLFVTFANLQEQYNVLSSAAIDAEEKWQDQRTESTFDALEARQTLFEARQAALKAEYEKLKILLQLYLGLGVI